LNLYHQFKRITLFDKRRSMGTRFHGKDRKGEEVMTGIQTGGGIERIYRQAAWLQDFGIGFLRLALVVVLCWIGGLKFADYEADSIVPLVANSPLMGFVYRHPAPEYRPYMNKEGERNPAHHRWQKGNGTYSFSHGLGVVIITIGCLIALHSLLPQVAAIGSFLLIGMAVITLSFLVTTPEAWVPALGDTAHGFPYLSGAGRLIVKDLIMLGAAVVTMADSAAVYLHKKEALVRPSRLSTDRRFVA
jgi:uncharacterized membrane protein YkgB